MLSQASWRRMASLYAPNIAHGLWWRSELGAYDTRDFITRVAMHGSYEDVARNYTRIASMKDAEFKACVYWWGAETPTHRFLGYAWYHPYDWCSGWWRRFKGPREADEHPNDMEGTLVMANHKTGRVEAAFLVRHWDILPYVFMDHDTWQYPWIVRSLVHRPQSTMQVRRPLDGRKITVYVEPGSHAPDCWNAEDRLVQWAQQEKQAVLVEGLVYAYSHPQTLQMYPRRHVGTNLQWVKYELESIAGVGSLMDQIDNPAVFGVRGGRSVFMEVSGRTGEVQPGKATPPWAWKSINDPESTRGQLFYDPAAFAQRYLYSKRNQISEKYLWNLVQR